MPIAARPAAPRRQGTVVAAGVVRRDIQGLRAVAVALVVLFHLWPGRVRGGFVGVDVFLVVSGFLITSHLLRRPPRTWHDLGEFWGRRIRRLLPAAFLVLLVTLAGSRLVLPHTQWEAAARETVAAGFYVENWSLAAGAVDYLAAQDAPSPVQHYWSLSVEEQFYLAWPVLVLALVGLALYLRRRAGRPLTVRNGRVPLVGLGILVVTGASLWWSVHLTAVEPAAAYFVTPTRVWELTAGGLLAYVAFGSDGLPGRGGTVAGLLAWTGLALIGWSALTMSAATAFPGIAAAVPVGGAVLFLAARSEHGPWSPTRILGTRGGQWLGDVSYSVYLWHWPLIVLTPYLLDRALRWPEKLLLLAVTALLAGLTKRYVEDRWRGVVPLGRPLRRSFAFAAAGMAVVLLAGSLLQAEVARDRDAAAAAVPVPGQPCVGAAALAPDAHCPDEGTLRMDPEIAAADRSAAYAQDCWVHPPFDDYRTCVFGTQRAPARRIALVGNSHAGHWLPALQTLAAEHDWQITTYLASACPAAAGPVEFPSSASGDGCLAWGRQVMADTTAGDYDLVITAERNVYPFLPSGGESEGAAATRAYGDYLRQWAKAGTHVLVLRDTPFPGRSVPDCLAAHEDDPAACDGPRSWLPDDPLYEVARTLRSRQIDEADLTPYVCLPDRCPAVIGGLVVYFDGSHLTATYARTLAPYLDRVLEPLLR